MYRSSAVVFAALCLIGWAAPLATRGAAMIDSGGRSRDTVAEPPPDDPGDPPAPDFEEAQKLVRTESGGLPLGVGIGVTFEPIAKEDSREFKGAKLGVTQGVEISRSAVADRHYLEPSLERFIKFKASGRLTYQVRGEIGKGPLELDGKIFSGVKVEYEVKMPEDAYADGGFPHPFDPDSMPEGSEIVLEASRMRGTAMGMVFRHIALETEYSTWEGMAIGVEKIGPGQLRLVAGPTQGVQNELFLGIALGALQFGIGNSTTLKEYRLKTAVYDVDSESGREAYLRALASGHIDSDEPGAERAGSVRKLSYLSETGAQIKTKDIGASIDLPGGQKVRFALPGITLEKTLSASEGERKISVFPALGEEHDELLFRYNERSYSLSTLRVHGEITKQTVGAVFRGLHPASAGYLYEAFNGSQRKFEKEVDLQLVFSGEEAMELQSNAREMTKDLSAPAIGGSLGVLEQLGSAKTPFDVVLALSRPHPGFVAEALLLLHYHRKIPVSGLIRLHS